MVDSVSLAVEYIQSRVHWQWILESLSSFKLVEIKKNQEKKKNPVKTSIINAIRIFPVWHRKCHQQVKSWAFWLWVAFLVYILGMLIQQSQRKRKCDCRAINNNAASWDSSHFSDWHATYCTSTWWAQGPKMKGGFGQGTKNAYMGLGGKRQHRMLHAAFNRLAQNSFEKCGNLFPARHPVWTSVFASLQTVGESYS